jgi:1-phosphofructokinase family hexose kinase
MIVTVTPNTTLDQTLFVSAFQKGRTIRATQSVQSMGGKPTDASFILGELGLPSLALGFAAGAVGDRVETMLRARGVTTDFIRVGGESRLNVIIVDESDNTHTSITTSSLDVQPVHTVMLRQQFERALGEASCVVLGGTLPNGIPPKFYADLIRLARTRGLPVIFDASGPNLNAGLTGRPTFIKPNRDELAGLAGGPVESLEQAYRIGRMVLDRYDTAPIITLDDEGGLAVLPDRTYRIPAIPVEVVSAAGAGDAILAGLAAAFERGLSVEDGLRLGFAAATAVCLTPGTADCRKEDVQRFLPQIELIPYNEQ